MSHGGRVFRQVKKLFEKQGGLCHYCKELMTLARPGRHEKTPPNMATLEHLDDRYSPERGSYNDGRTLRRVAACWKCNGERNALRQADPNVVSKEELRRRATHPPRLIIAMAPTGS